MYDRYIVKLNLARNCLRYIIRAYSIRKLWMPYYICPTLWLGARKEGCRIAFYHIDKNFYPAVEFGENDFILYPNYFGVCSENVFILCKKYKNLIVDNAHNFYMPDCGLASFNSLRKFFNVKDGAYLYTSRILDEYIEQDDYYYEKPCGSLNYEQLAENEKRLDSENIKIISDCTEKYFAGINFEREKFLRLEKFRKLHERFSYKNELNLKLGKYDVPFVYPYLIKDENAGANLEKEGFLILRYWENLPETFLEYDFYKYLVPIPLNV